MDDYKRFMGYSDIEFAASMKAMVLVDSDIVEIACQTVAMDTARQEQGDAADNDQWLLESQELELKQNETIEQWFSLNEEDFEYYASRAVRRSTEVETFKQIRKEQARLLRKIGAAVFGGLALIAPMLIMLLHPSIITVTVTTSVFVLVVSFLVAIAMKDTEPKDVVAATAAYAAVLVVFVGGSGGGGSGGSTRNGTENSSSMSNAKVGGIVAGSIVGTLLLMIALLVLWCFIAAFVPGMPIPIPGAENPRTNEKGELVPSIWKRLRAEDQQVNKRSEGA